MTIVVYLISTSYRPSGQPQTKLTHYRRSTSDMATTTSAIPSVAHSYTPYAHMTTAPSVCTTNMYYSVYNPSALTLALSKCNSGWIRAMVMHTVFAIPCCIFFSGGLPLNLMRGILQRRRGQWWPVALGGRSFHLDPYLYPYLPHNRTYQHIRIPGMSGIITRGTPP